MGLERFHEKCVNTRWSFVLEKRPLWSTNCYKISHLEVVIWPCMFSCEKRSLLCRRNISAIEFWSEWHHFLPWWLISFRLFLSLVCWRLGPQSNLYQWLEMTFQGPNMFQWIWCSIDHFYLWTVKMYIIT